MIASTEQTAAAEIRPATPSDLPRVEQLLTQNDLPLDGIPASLDGFVVAEANGELVGVAGIETCCDDALLRSVAVRPEWRTHGIGRALVTQAILNSESRGMRALYLLTTTAERYFPSFGFKRIDRAEVPQAVRETQEFAKACPETATVMARSLRD